MTEFIKERLVQKKFFKNVVALPNTRYSHYAVCAQLCLLTLRGAKEDLKLKNLEKFFGDYAGFDHKSLEAKKISLVIKYLEAAFSGAKDSTLRNRANIVSAFYLVSDLSARGNIAGRVKEVGAFFHKFIKSLHGEFQKAPDKRDPALISYQSAVTQGADKIKSVNTRHDILLKKLALKNKFFHDLIHPPSPKERFRILYEKARTVSKSKNSSVFEGWLMKNKELKQFKCANSRGAETFVGHIRHCLHHAQHGKFTSQNLTKGTKILEEIVG